MLAPSKPENESDRQAAINTLDIVYSPAEERFDRITRIAKRLFDVPIALISIVSEDIQWFKSRQGLTVPETEREISFCGHAILREDTFVVPNATHDPDFKDNPLVTGEPKIRFYAGQPIHYQGQRIGTLCIISNRPRHFKPRDYDSIKSLGLWVEAELNSDTEAEQEYKKISDRKSCIDPVTGDFNKMGLETLRKIVLESETVSKAPPTLQIEMQKGFADILNAESIKEISSVIHTVINDRGTVSFDPESGFAILLNSSAAIHANQIQEELQTTLEDFPRLAQTNFQLHLQP